MLEAEVLAAVLGEARAAVLELDVGDRLVQAAVLSEAAADRQVAGVHRSAIPPPTPGTLFTAMSSTG